MGWKKSLDRSCQCLCCCCPSPVYHTHPPNFSEQKKSCLKLGSWLTLTSACLIPLQKLVSWNKDMSINTQGSVEVVCKELTSCPTSPKPTELQLCPPHWCHYIFYHSHSSASASFVYLTAVLTMFLRCDMADFDPLTDPILHFLYSNILERWQLNIWAAVPGHSSCTDWQRVNIGCSSGAILLP